MLDTLFAKVAGRRVPERAGSDGVQIAPWYTRDGSAVVTPLEFGWAAEGNVFVANAGSATTPITFGAGSIDTTEPDFDLLLPAGSQLAIVPLEIQINFETFGTDLLVEGMASIGLGGAQSSTGATAVTPRALRLDKPKASVTTCYSNVDAGATYMTQEVSEIFRFSIQKAATTGTGDDDSNRLGEIFTWRAREAGVYPIMTATALGARLNVFGGAQAGTGFIRVVFAEIPAP